MPEPRPETTALDMLFADSASRGLWVNNLFQLGLAPKPWQANVTDGAKCYEFGRGPTPAAALAAALSKVKQ